MRRRSRLTGKRDTVAISSAYNRAFSRMLTIFRLILGPRKPKYYSPRTTLDMNMRMFGEGLGRREYITRMRNVPPGLPGRESRRATKRRPYEATTSGSFERDRRDVKRASGGSRSRMERRRPDWPPPPGGVRRLQLRSGEPEAETAEPASGFRVPFRVPRRATARGSSE